MLQYILLISFIVHIVSTIVPTSINPAQYALGVIFESSQHQIRRAVPDYRQGPEEDDRWWCNVKGDQVTLCKDHLLNVVRRHCGLTDASYAACLCPDKLLQLSADSKSGQSFWKSTDGTLVVKTIKEYEYENMKSIMEDYVMHITTDQSCLTNIVGLYRVRMASGQKFQFLVARNVFDIADASAAAAAAVAHTSTSAIVHSLATTLKYDLKGSTHGRNKADYSSVLKDNDLLKGNSSFSLGSTQKMRLMKALKRDVAFLSLHNFMDYSLMVSITGVSTRRQQEEAVVAFSAALSRWPASVSSSWRRRKDASAACAAATAAAIRGNFVLTSASAANYPGANGDTTYYYQFGIIDFLQQYTARKKVEKGVKGIWSDSTTISCMDPERYADRLIRFIDAHTR